MPLAEDVIDEALELRLFGRARPTAMNGAGLAALLRELKRPGVTMMVLWEEYRAINQKGYGYSRFCDLLRGFERRLTPLMRQHHVSPGKDPRRLLGQADRDRRSGDGRNP